MQNAESEMRPGPNGESTMEKNLWFKAFERETGAGDVQKILG